MQRLAHGGFATGPAAMASDAMGSEAAEPGATEARAARPIAPREGSTGWTGTGVVCVLAALLAVIGMSVRHLPDMRSGGLSNPDTYMRLVRLRDMLHAGTVLDVVARDGSGHGTVLHWSHLIDSLLCLIALPFSLVLKPDDALHAAALVFGPLGIAALGFAVAWAAAPFAERKWLFLGAVLPALSPAIVSYGVAGVVHHHVAIVLVTVACWGWTARLLTGRAPATAGIALGTWAALGIWFTPESVPLTMMAFGALGLAWIEASVRDAGTRTGVARAIGLTGVSFAAVTTLALLVDPPAAGFGALDIDRLSLVFVGLALAVGAMAAGVWAVDRLIPARGTRIAAACAIGLLCCGLWVLCCRGALFRDNMLLDQRQRDAMFGHINEMLPVGGPLAALHFLLTGTLAAAILIALAARRRALMLSYAAACLCGLLVLGWLHVRFAAYPEVAGAIALPIALTMATQTTRSRHQIVQSFARLATILLFIQVPYLGQLPDVTGSARAAPMMLLPDCAVADAIPMLASIPARFCWPTSTIRRSCCIGLRFARSARCIIATSPASCGCARPGAPRHPGRCLRKSTPPRSPWCWPAKRPCAPRSWRMSRRRRCSIRCAVGIRRHG